MPAVKRSPWGGNWVDLMNEYSYLVESQFDPLDLSQSPGERFRRQRPVYEWDAQFAVTPVKIPRLRRVLLVGVWSPLS